MDIKTNSASAMTMAHDDLRYPIETPPTPDQAIEVAPQHVNAWWLSIFEPLTLMSDGISQQRRGQGGFAVLQPQQREYVRVGGEPTVNQPCMPTPSIDHPDGKQCGLCVQRGMETRYTDHRLLSPGLG